MSDKEEHGAAAIRRATENGQPRETDMKITLTDDDGTVFAMVKFTPTQEIDEAINMKCTWNTTGDEVVDTFFSDLRTLSRNEYRENDNGAEPEASERIH